MPHFDGKPFEQSKYGILSDASQVLTPDNERWVANFTHSLYDSDVIAENVLQQMIGGGALQTDIVYNNPDGRTPSSLEYTPFFVETRVSGSTLEADSDKKREKAEEALNIVQQKAIEKEVWSGTLSKTINTSVRTGDYRQNRFFSDFTNPNFTSLSDTALSPDKAVALLEEGIGEYTLGIRGVIHMPRRIASLASIEADSGDSEILYTELGNYVIAGSGYTKIGNDYWIFGTGPMTVVLGAAQIIPGEHSQAVDTRKNNIEYIAQKPVGVFWTTSTVLGVKVDPNL